MGKSKDQKKKDHRGGKRCGVVLTLAALSATLTGCKAFYENSGTNLAVGEITAPAEFSEPSESLTVRLLFDMTGARAWTAKDAKVSVEYRNTYTNSYVFGMADKTGVQDFKVKVEPLQVDAPPSP